MHFPSYVELVELCAPLNEIYYNFITLGTTAATLVLYRGGRRKGGWGRAERFKTETLMCMPSMEC